MAALADASGTAVAPQPCFVVKVGDMESYEHAPCLCGGMSKTQLLETLAGSRSFGGYLAGVSRLPDCDVYVNAVEPEPDVAGTVSLAGVAKLSSPVPGAADCYLRIQLPAATSAGDPAAGGAAGGDISIAQVVAKLGKLRLQVEAAEAKGAQRRLAGLVVHPSPPIKGSPTRASARSADETARIELKVRTLKYYGLLASEEGDDKKLWTARTMLHSPDAPPLPLEACTLAHIWSSELAWLAGEIATELHLPDNFYTKPRNYLVLPKDAHDGFDNHSLIFLPGSGGGVRVRQWRVEGRSADEAAAVSKYFGKELTWPNKAVATHLPFMRLLAWRMLTAIKKQPKDEPDISWGGKQNAALNASLQAEDNEAVRDLCDRLSLL